MFKLGVCVAEEPDFVANKPMVLLVGQRSIDKATFIRFLLDEHLPGAEPTTEGFTAVMHAPSAVSIAGDALIADRTCQFRPLCRFGDAFLNRFHCSFLPNDVLHSITIVATPAIISGEKQRMDQGYDFLRVLEWFAERADRILLLFDAHKLDVSDEFKGCIEALGGHEDKMRVILSKADMVDHEELMRVYGALMWSLGKVFRTPEVPRVFIGSFCDQPLHLDSNRRLFADLHALPRNVALRKLNDLVKRARLAKVHAYIVSELRKQMPSVMGKEKKKKELIANLDKVYLQIQREHGVSAGDFPDLRRMQELLQHHDLCKLARLKQKALDVVDDMLASDMARLMTLVPKEENGVEKGEDGPVRGSGGAIGFGVGQQRYQYNAAFNELNPVVVNVHNDGMLDRDESKPDRDMDVASSCNTPSTTLEADELKLGSLATDILEGVMQRAVGKTNVQVELVSQRFAIVARHLAWRGVTTTSLIEVA